jgi:hypothetical protein
MATPSLAVHQAIVVVDVEGFGDRRRTNTNQVAVRAGLYRVMGEAFGRAGISWRDCRREDRGDGVLVLVPVGERVSRLVEGLPSALVAGLTVITSSWFFETVVQHGSAAAEYRLVEVAVKETKTTGWVCLPDQAEFPNASASGLGVVDGLIG